MRRKEKDIISLGIVVGQVICSMFSKTKTKNTKNEKRNKIKKYKAIYVFRFVLQNEARDNFSIQRMVRPVTSLLLG